MALEPVCVIVRSKCVTDKQFEGPKRVIAYERRTGWVAKYSPYTDNDSPHPFILQIQRHYGFGDVAAAD